MKDKLYWVNGTDLTSYEPISRSRMNYVVVAENDVVAVNKLYEHFNEPDREFKWITKELTTLKDHLPLERRIEFIEELPWYTVVK